MRFIKLGIISIVFFAVFHTILSFFFPSHIRISKATDIPAEKDSLMMNLSNPVYWKKWYPGADSANVIPNGIRTGDERSLVVTGITDSTVTIASGGPGAKEGAGGWNIFPGSSPGVYTVQWYMDFSLRWYPWEKFSGLLLEKRYGPMMEKGLEKLKALLSEGTS